LLAGMQNGGRPRFTGGETRKAGGWGRVRDSAGGEGFVF